MNNHLFRFIFYLAVSFLFAGWLATHTAPAQPAAGAAPNGRVLMFVAYNDVWWPEYKVAYEGLVALGYEVDVVSSGTGVAYSYGGPVDNSILTSFAQFEALFAANFGLAWNPAWTAQQTIPLDGRIQDITDLDEYDAIVLPGGRGAVAYQYDGSYAALSPQDAPGSHSTTAAEVQAAAEKLNELINMALAAGKPVGAQCHGAPVVAFARIAGTAGSGFDGLGTSILADRYATGYPLADGTVAADYANLDISYLNNEKVVLDGPDAPHYGGQAGSPVLTSRDWHPETVAYFTYTLHNMLASYPTPAERTAALAVLVYGGDEPGHYAPQQPAYHTDLAALLNDAGDDLNITAVATSNTNDINLANLQNYDVLLYFRHDAIPQAAQDAIASYVDEGGGLVGLHHAIYNHQDGKDTLVNLFGGELSSAATLNNEQWLVYWGEDNHLINVNLGHFVSSYGTHLLPGQTAATVNYNTPLGLPNANLDNDAGRGYYSFTIPDSDELYVGGRFNDDVVFGTGVNEVNRLFANDRYVAGSPNPNNGHYDAWGWTKVYDTDGNGIGRIVYLQPGETNDRTFAHPSYRQSVKNAIIWASLGSTEQNPTAVTAASFAVGGADVSVGVVAAVLLVVLVTVGVMGKRRATN
jgi:putative intracellular protease/amidase/type 1 glutamine amidotransferase